MELLHRNTAAEDPVPAAPPQPKEPNLIERGSRAVWKEYRAWLERHEQEEPDDLIKQSKKDGATVGAAFKNGLIATAAMIVPLGCAVIAFLAAGFYFNGGKDWNGTTASV